VSVRALVADDQPLARERLVSLLSAAPDVRVVGTAATGREAVDAIQAQAPDLVFLDVQMPELDGVAVIEAVGHERMPATVFVTAFDEFAIRAFEVHALDYLLKPFGRLRFEAALDRARRFLDRERAGELASRLAALLDDLKTPHAHGERLMVRNGGRVAFVPVDQIDWIEAEGNYTRLHVGPEFHLQRETMGALLARLGDARFFRIHRSLRQPGSCQGAAAGRRRRLRRRAQDRCPARPQPPLPRRLQERLSDGS
jgi:two-component system, LytTR family, response regulator